MKLTETQLGFAGGVIEAEVDRDEVEDGEGAMGVAVLAGGSPVDVWAGGTIDIVWLGCTIAVIVLGGTAFDVWWGVAEGFTVVAAGANGVVVL